MRIGPLFIILLNLFYCHLVLSQDSTQLSIRTIEAYAIEKAIQIDGELSEPEWSLAMPSANFIQNFPNPGKISRQNTEVKVMYDNNSIYIGAYLEDICKDSISCTLSERDRNENADYFAVGFDTYNDDQNAFGFVVTSAGVQQDIRFSANNDDDAWNAVWYSAVKVSDKGWIVEMKIPFAALRFSEKDEQLWGINFKRNIRRYREDSFWNYVDPLIEGEVNQYGNLIGLKNIKSPIRLSLTPYVSGYYTRYDDNTNQIHEDQTNFNGGMDLKYGLNEAFTLDMTLIPDFGQVQSDNQVLNTTPFEVKFNEFRQFFTEGTEIYNKSGLFYSRRIGGTPINYDKPYYELNDGETVTQNPSSTKLINATKITGRTNSGTGIGFFNAITKPSFAIITDSVGNSRNIETNPLTNYNVFVIDQNLKNNSYFNLTNTNVMRNGSTYDANTTGFNTQINTKGNKFGLDARGTITQQYGIYNPDSIILGYTWGLGASKKYGNYTYGAYYGEESDKYDPNDLGFLYNNNSRVFFIESEHRTYEPKGLFLRTWQNLNFNYERLFNPNVFTTVNASGGSGMVFRNWTAAGLEFYTSFIETYDYFEPRVTGRYYTLPRSLLISGFISTDYRKKFALDIKPEFIKFDYMNWREFSLYISPRFRFNNKLSTILSSSFNVQYGDQGSALSTDGEPTIINDTIVFAIRDRTNYENTISLKYIFTNKMALTFRVRHYWAKLEYHSFYNLTNDGYLESNSYTGLAGDGTSLHNTSFNAFNIDLVYTWVFAPGSEIRIVWKNSIYDFSQKIDLSYTDDFNATLKAPQTNSISVKMIYYLDVARFRKKI